MKYKISKKAFEDIEKIWFYTMETWSVQQADRYYNLIFDEIEYIAEYPLLGKDCSHIRKNYRCLTIKAHLIFYKYKKDKKIVEIIRIFHQSVDIEDKLKG